MFWASLALATAGVAAAPVEPVSVRPASVLPPRVSRVLAWNTSVRNLPAGSAIQATLQRLASPVGSTIGITIPGVGGGEVTLQDSHSAHSRAADFASPIGGRAAAAKSGRPDGGLGRITGVPTWDRIAHRFDFGQTHTRALSSCIFPSTSFTPRAIMTAFPGRTILLSDRSTSSKGTGATGPRHDRYAVGRRPASVSRDHGASFGHSFSPDASLLSTARISVRRTDASTRANGFVVCGLLKEYEGNAIASRASTPKAPVVRPA